MTSTQRSIIRDALSNYEEIKHPIRFESKIYSMCTKLTDQYDVGIDKIYTKVAYEIIGELHVDPSRKKYILSDIGKCIIGYDTDAFREYREREKRETTIGINRPHIKSGQFKCKKCGSDQCSYTQSQTSSCDEGFTTYVVCEICGGRYSFK